jgi:hypothetical protein
MKVRRRPAAWPAGAIALAGLFSAFAAVGGAQDRSAVIRVLDDSGGDFRVRVQAAFAAGNSRDPAFEAPLARALHDPNPAVRAAAATSLGRLGQTSAIPALQGARHDSSAAVRMQAEHSLELLEQASGPAIVPNTALAANGSGHGFLPTIAVVPTEGTVAWPSVRWVVVLGVMANRSGFAGDDLANRLRAEVENNLRRVRGVAIVAEADPRVRQEVQQRHIPSLRLEGSLARVERRVQPTELAVRCEVSLVLLDEPARNMRGALNGAATGIDAIRGPRAEQERRLAEQALSGAVHSAISQAPIAFARATGH